MRLQIAAFIGLFLVGAAFCIWLVQSELQPMLAASAAGAAVVDVTPGDAIGVPLGAMFICFAVLPILPRPDPPRTRSGFIRTTRLFDAVFLAAIACMPLTPLARPIGSMIVSDVMTARDYRTCPHPDWRHPPTRWVRTALPCLDDGE